MAELGRDDQVQRLERRVRALARDLGLDVDGLDPGRQGIHIGSLGTLQLRQPRLGTRKSPNAVHDEEDDFFSLH